MKKWLFKSFVALVTILTFGLVSPQQVIQAINNPLGQHVKDNVVETETADTEDVPSSVTEGSPLSDRERFLSDMVNRGEVQAIQKFGPKIAPVIEDEFQQIILPNIGRAIEGVIEQFSDKDLAYLTISEVPGGGISEKIFHIYDGKTGRDIIRFHVRRDLRPQEGYWFNFHYHTYHDHFHTHYELGDIYWDKNTPPNWRGGFPQN